MTQVRTTPPERHVLLYDGRCRFCELGATRIVRLARRGLIEKIDFQQPGVLERFPGIAHDMCMKQMYLITPEGKAIAGFEAAVAAVGTRPVLGWIAYLYYLPGLRWLLDRLYAVIARNRYRIMGRVDECADGTCSLHFGKR
jgi:predicted DCC family thiol-disulfide oxidoreductase YuxK